MKIEKLKIFVFLEYFLAGFYFLVVFSPHYLPVAESYPFITDIALIISFIALLLVTIAYVKRNSGGYSYFFFILISLTAYLGIRNKVTGSTLEYPMSMLVISISALTGKKLAWLIPFFIFIIGEKIEAIPLLLLGEKTLSFSLLYSGLSSDIYLYLFSVGMGILFSFLGKEYNNKILSQSNKPIGTENNNTFQKIPPPTESKIFSVSDPTQTGFFTVRDFSAINSVNEREIAGLLSSVVFFMSRNFRAYSSLGFIFDPQKKVFILNDYYSKSINIVKNVAIPLGAGIVGRIGTEKHSFMSGDLRVYNAELLYYQKDEQINSILAVPIVSDTNELLGALVLDSTDKHAFRDEDKEILKRFSKLAAALITTAKMRSKEERNARMFQIFYETSSRFTNAIHQEMVFDILFEMTSMFIPIRRLLVVTIDPERNMGIVSFAKGEIHSFPQLRFSFPINKGLYSSAYLEKRIIPVYDFQELKRNYYRFVPDEPEDPLCRSLMIFPLTDDNEQKCIGLFSIESDIPEVFKGETEQIILTLFTNASVALKRASLYEKMERLATTDGLTGLNNHRHFQEILAFEIERAKRYKHPLSLLIMDIDHFKSFNDTYGHPIGDLVLKEIAKCIRKSKRVNDIAARYGGEEFVVIVPETPIEKAIITGERIRTTIENHIIFVDNLQLRVTVSIGCSSFPQFATSQQALID
ncbi:MAG: diguanylate cyclase, partial [Chitinispirillaceae bacterium]|nr:diguanylate cyclase [Chitinispirillaceae bacterium]